jgi:hypothetical protein
LVEKYWALLNPYVPLQEKVKKMFPQGASKDDSNDYQYAQLDTPEYQPDEPILSPESLRKIKIDETVNYSSRNKRLLVKRHLSP